MRRHITCTHCQENRSQVECTRPARPFASSEEHMRRHITCTHCQENRSQVECTRPARPCALLTETHMSLQQTLAGRIHSTCERFSSQPIDLTYFINNLRASCTKTTILDGFAHLFQASTNFLKTFDHHRDDTSCHQRYRWHHRQFMCLR